MVEHVVTIEHSFKAPGGAELFVQIDQGTNTITVKYRAKAGEPAIELSPMEMLELRELFVEAGKMVS